MRARVVAYKRTAASLPASTQYTGGNRTITFLINHRYVLVKLHSAELQTSRFPIGDIRLCRNGQG